MTTAMQSALIMASAGVGIPLLAALNAALGRHLGSPASAGVILFVVALAIALAVAVVTGGSFRAAASAPPHLFIAGAFVAFYVLSVTWIAPSFGVGNAIFFVLLGQLVSAAVIDHFALFGALHSPMTPIRLLGIAVMGAGVFLTQIAGRA